MEATTTGTMTTNKAYYEVLADALNNWIDSDWQPLAEQALTNLAEKIQRESQLTGKHYCAISILVGLLFSPDERREGLVSRRLITERVGKWAEGFEYCVALQAQTAVFERKN